jgi:hypothetical protein
MAGIAIPRHQWGALTVYPRGHRHAGDPIVIPRDNIRKTELAAHHSVHPNRNWTREQEERIMREIQFSHIMERRFADFAYNWAIFPSGRMYTGRGFQGVPAGQFGENPGTWAAVFIGDFREVEPLRLARLKLQDLIERLIDFSDGRLDEFGGHREFPNQATECPGDELMDVVKRNRERFDLRVPRN